MNTEASDVAIAASVDTEDRGYDALCASMQDRFLQSTMEGREPLFRTDASDLFDVYLDALPAEWRQHHTCNACRQFFERFGGLVTIYASGETTPAFWDPNDAGPFYRDAVEAVSRRVHRARVVGVFLSSEAAWGRHEAGGFTHFALTPPPAAIFRPSLLDADQAMAAKLEDFRNVQRALGEFTAATVERALALLQTSDLYRAEKVIGPAQWLHQLHTLRAAARGNGRENIVWRAIMDAPAGYCHPRSSMVGTLLADIADGLPFAAVQARFAEKMAPTQYRRPQAAPTAGNIEQAEKIIERLCLARALERRYARLDELQLLWKPRAPVEAPPRGVFGHLRGVEKAMRQIDASGPVLTFAKFRRGILPHATAVEVLVPMLGNFAGMLTAAHDDAPPLLQWDREDRRNPVSWYVYPRGSLAARWGLIGGEWTPVTGVCLKPPQWSDGVFPHFGAGAVFVIAGARDERAPSSGLFPEILRTELHAVRATIEAHSRTSKPAGVKDASACGLMLDDGSTGDVKVRVTTAAGLRTAYRIDRWE